MKVEEINMLSELSHFLEESKFSQNIVKQSIRHLHDLYQWFEKCFTEDTTPLDIVTLRIIK